MKAITLGICALFALSFAIVGCDTTEDANKERAVPAGCTRRFTMLAEKTTLHYSSESGDGTIGRLSRVVTP